MSQFTDILYLPAQYPSQPRPLLFDAPEVAHHFRPDVVLCHKNSTQILEGRDLGDRESVVSEWPLNPLPWLFLHQATTLTPHSPSAEDVARCRPFSDLYEKNVALRADGVGEVTTLQDICISRFKYDLFWHEHNFKCSDVVNVDVTYLW